MINIMWEFVNIWYETIAHRHSFRRDANNRGHFELHRDPIFETSFV